MTLFPSRIFQRYYAERVSGEIGVGGSGAGGVDGFVKAILFPLKPLETTAYSIEFKIRRQSDGIVLDIHSLAQYDKEQNVVFGVIHDITDWKRVEKDLRESEERYRSIVEASPDIVWEIDTRGNITFVSSLSERVLGYTPEELIGKPFISLVQPESHETVLKMFMSYMREKMSFVTLDVPAVRRDGSPIVIEIRSILIKDDKGQGTGFRGITRDITDR